MKVILYKGALCPKCKVIATKLEKKGIEFEAIDNVQDILAAGVRTIPTLSVDGTLYTDVKACNEWINSLEGAQ